MSVTFKRLVVLRNPRSSNAKKAVKITASLEKAYPGKVVKGVIHKTEADNIAFLKDTLRSGDILVVCGGDGTIGSTVQNLLDPTIPIKLRQTPLLPVGTGRMNDFARILNGRHADDPVYILKHGQKKTVHPIKCVCTPLDTDKKPLTKTAIYSLGFGYSGEGSVILNDPEYRAKPQLRNPITRRAQLLKDGWDLLKRSRYFQITLKDKRLRVLDISAANGHILYGYWRVPIKLSQREFYLKTLDDKSLATTAKTVTEMATKSSGGEAVTSASFILHDPVIAHIGGETFDPPAPCVVDITHHKEAVIMIATDPKA